jgi:hypothetical protein
MPYVMGEIIITLLTIVVEAVLWINSAEIPPASAHYAQGLLVLAFALSLAYLLICIRRVMREGWQPPKTQPVAGATLQLFILCGMTILYLFLLDIIGYLILTPFFVLACIVYLGMRKKFVLIFLPLFLTASTYYLFANVLFIFLPRGILG